MSNRRKLDTFKVAPHREHLDEAQKHMDEKGERLTRRMLRSMRHNRPVASIVLDHHKPHQKQENCGKACETRWTP